MRVIHNFIHYLNPKWYEVDFFGHKPTLKQRLKTFWALKFERSWKERYEEWRNMKPNKQEEKCQRRIEQSLDWL